ncbi:hypothetical protein SAMN04488541_101256 [Thermoflexibacter ruber]|uniref:Uncharacterized protein n=1 Tax=Thermoflexibacter ruber TaxID=1003 RepID=A0A1I2F4P3_9BACT|nr:hypothetical protein SAMN04488541_101256 [Thermoflexibacter ruber]
MSYFLVMMKVTQSLKKKLVQIREISGIDYKKI